MKQILFIPIACMLFVTIQAQHPFSNHREGAEVRYSSSMPVIHYILRVDAGDVSSFTVEMNVKNVKDTFRVAMVTHPEYDDRYWRFVEWTSVEGKKGTGRVLREDSALWRVTTNGGEAVLKYRVKLHPSESFRGAWRPFLNNRGILFGGPHSFMYVLGATLAPAYVKLELPHNWKIATGLTATTDPKTFFAPNVSVLVESPILAGIFKSWNFLVDAVPHQVVYWPGENVASIDTATLLMNMKKLVEQAAALFGRLPYREYIFILQDSAWGGLEHYNSVTLGAPVHELRNNMKGFLNELAHEYFHTWNLMRIHPVEYGDVSYKKQTLSKGLWWSEGLTIFYADLLLRRAGLPVYDSTRLGHLQTLLKRYYNYSGHYKLSAEKVSEAAYGERDMLGDYNASTHGQGEVIGAMLDIIVRDASNGRKTMDDVMRSMMELYSGPKGFTGTDIESVVEKICGCDVTKFFDAHIRAGSEIDFDKSLSLIGLKKTMTWVDATMDDGRPAPDFRTYAYQKENDTAIRFGLMDPESIWGKAGLHTGDVIVSVNAKPLKNPRDFRAQLGALKIGDSFFITVKRPAGLFSAAVVITGYKRPEIKIEPMPAATEKQRRLREQWMSGQE